MKWLKKLRRWLKGEVIVRKVRPHPERDKLVQHRRRYPERDRFPERKCNHEWRLFGNRLEESVSIPVRIPPRNCGSVVCTKCGTSQYAEDYEEIERRPIPEYSGSWAMFKDVIVKVNGFGIHTSTCVGYDEKTNEVYEKGKWKWDDEKEEWIKT